MVVLPAAPPIASVGSSRPPLSRSTKWRAREPRAEPRTAPAPAVAQPGEPGPGPFPTGGDDLRNLRRLRDELAREVSSLRARAEALQAEARALETGR